jgi:hypothetical protein
MMARPSFRVPTFHGTAGNQGKYGIWLSDYGCAYAGGYTPESRYCSNLFASQGLPGW